MTRVLTTIACLVSLAAAVREETHPDAFLELEEGLEQEMTLVPAKISKAIRRAGRMAQAAMEEAEAKKANMTQAKEVAAQKATAASELQATSSQALEEAAQKREEAQKKKAAAEQAILDEGKANEALDRSVKATMAKEAALTQKENEYREFKEVVAKKIQELADQKMAAAQQLDQLREELDAMNDETNRLKTEAAAKGGMSEKASEHAQAAEAEMDEADEKATQAQAVAEKAQNDFISAKAEADTAAQMYFEANAELEKKTDMHQMVEMVRTKTDDFYKALDQMTTSMEATLKQQKESGSNDTKPAYELVREDTNVRASMEAYNEMVIVFQRLHSKNKEFYDFIVGSVHEIQENANAAYTLQCDPTEELEMSVGKEEFQEKCGKGMWKDLQLERFKFPHKKSEVNPKAKLPE